MSEILIFTVPLIPPDLNHYVRHTRGGRHYVTSEAKKFKADMALLINGRHVIGKSFQVHATFYLGEGRRGDVDGFGKLLLDSLAESGVFRTMEKGRDKELSDAHVTDLLLRKRRDPANPRTEIEVKAI